MDTNDGPIVLLKHPSTSFPLLSRLVSTPVMCSRWIKKPRAATVLLLDRCISPPFVSRCSGSFQAAKLDTAPVGFWRWEPWLVVTLSPWVPRTGVMMKSPGDIVRSPLQPRVFGEKNRKKKGMKSLICQHVWWLGCFVRTAQFWTLWHFSPPG